MRRSPLLPAVLALIVLAVGVAPARALTVSLSPGAGSSYVAAALYYGGLLLNATATAPIASLPAAGQVQPFITTPPYDSLVDFDLGHAGFHHTFDVSRADTAEDQTGAAADLYFHVDEAASYDLTGMFEVSDPGGLLSSFVALLEDLTTSTGLAFYNGIDASTTASFTLGDGFTQGSLQGTLLPGHDYRLQFEALSYAQLELGGTDQGFTAVGSGFVTLAIPEPGAVWLLLPALAVLAGRLRPRAGRAAEADRRASRSEDPPF